VKRLASLTLATVLVLAACGAGDASTAATVGDIKITAGEVNSMFTDQEITKATFANMLGLLIESAVMEKHAADEFGIVVTEEEIGAEADRIFDDFSAEGETREEFLSSRGYTENFLLKVAHQEVLWQKMADRFEEDGRGVPSDSEIEEGWTDTLISLTNACVSHILVGELQGLEGEDLEKAKTEALAEAEGILADLKGGADFAETAREKSVDTGSGAQGGDLGCSALSRYVKEFSLGVLDAPIGAVHEEPVLSQFGYHIILVRERTNPTDDEVRDEIIKNGVSSEIRSWLDEKIKATTVTVQERYGSWNPDAMIVVPPAN
jgi:foldase protein PrsA